MARKACPNEDVRLGSSHERIALAALRRVPNLRRETRCRVDRAAAQSRRRRRCVHSSRDLCRRGIRGGRLRQCSGMTPERMGLAARPRHDRIGNHRTDRQDKNREESAEHRPLHPSSDQSDRDPTTDRNARHSSRRPKYTPLGCAGGESHERSFAVATWPPCFSSRLRQSSATTPEGCLSIAYHPRHAETTCA
jgi:hypothetical protein